jgi:hypothetical protein
MLYWDLPEGTEENHKKPVRIAEFLYLRFKPGTSKIQVRRSITAGNHFISPSGYQRW